MRGKEEAHDYRYFPDPDLLPLVIDDHWIREIRENLPELPEEKRKRFMKQYDLSEYDAGILISSRDLAEYFEQCLRIFRSPKAVSNWITGPLLGLLNARGKTIEESPVSADNLARLLKLIDSGVISGKIAKTVFDEMTNSGKPPETIVEEKGLVQVVDADSIGTVIDGVLADHPKEVESYRNGKTKLMGFFVGQVMQATRGKANPKIVNDILRKKLGE
jgi:aspartyl-tRNA(Asn)/glutamyl-tRNA(Gln) amidotransferase subunit B